MAESKPDASPSPPEAGAKPCAIEDLERPSVLLTGERVKELRAEIVGQKNERSAFYQKTVKENADRWVKREITIPERAGHFHDFTCVDATRLRLPPDQQIGFRGPFECPACERTYTDEKYVAAMRNMEHLWIMSACRDLALAYAIEQQPDYAAKAAEILRKYADAYPGRHTTRTEGGIYYQSLDESMYFIPLAQAYDLIYDSGKLSDEDKRHIERDLFWESAEGLTKMGATTNWGSWHLSAVGVIGYATRHQRFIDYGLEQFKRQIREELGEDGLWPESVHTYHFFPLRAFVSLAEAATNAGNDLYAFEADGKSFRSMFSAPLAYMYPDTRLPAINDGWFGSFLPAEHYRAAYYRYRGTEFAWALKQIAKQPGAGQAGVGVRNVILQTVLGIDLPDVDTKNIAPGPTNFPVLGICTLRSGPEVSPERATMLTFDYGRMMGHGQPDKMGITLFANNRLLAADYGTPSYGSSILPYYKGTSSHNTVIVDEEDQKPTKKAELLAFAQDPLVQIASARTDEAYVGVNWRRSVIFAGDYALVVDDLASSVPRTYDWILHSEGKEFRWERAKPAPDAAIPQYKYFSEFRAFAPQAETAQARWQFKDKSGLRASIACDPDTTLISGRCPAETGARTVPVIVARRNSERTRFVVLLQPFRSASDPEFQLHASEENIITVDAGESQDRIEINDASFSFVRNENGDSRDFKVSLKELKENSD